MKEWVGDGIPNNSKYDFLAEKDARPCNVFVVLRRVRNCRSIIIIIIIIIIALLLL